MAPFPLREEEGGLPVKSTCHPNRIFLQFLNNCHLALEKIDQNDTLSMKMKMSSFLPDCTRSLGKINLISDNYLTGKEYYRLLFGTFVAIL
jgi:hypothetical protein